MLKQGRQMKLRRLKFKVKVDLPEGCKIADMQEYIEEAVATWKGCKHPEDSIFDLDWKTVKVTRLLDKKKVAKSGDTVSYPELAPSFY